MEGSRIAVLGGEGVLGSFVAKALTDRGHETARIGRRDRGPGRIGVDLSDAEAVAALAADYDLVLSTVRVPGLAPERAVLAHGGTLLNVASLTAVDRSSLADEDGEGLVVVHAGMHPGLSTLLLAELLRAHPEADGAEIVLTISIAGSGGRHGTESAAIPLLKRRRRHPTATVDVPEPFGRRRCMAVGDGSEGFFGEVGQDVRRRLYWCIDEPATHRALLAVNDLGATRLLPDRLLVAGRGYIPSALSTEVKRDVVAVTLGGRRLDGRVLDGRGDYAMAVAATVAFAEALLDRRAAGDTDRGCHGAEELFELEDLRPRLADTGVSIEPLAIGAASG